MTREERAEEVFRVIAEGKGPFSALWERYAEGFTRRTIGDATRDLESHGRIRTLSEYPYYAVIEK